MNAIAAKTLEHRLQEALRFSASRSVITAAEENAILAAFRAAPVMLEALKAQEELAALRFEGSPEVAIANVRSLRRAAIAKALPICKRCNDTGTVADYVGDDMRCIETGCPDCEAAS